MLFPREIKDHDVEFPMRYVLVNADTGDTLGTFDFTEIPGTVYQQGTKIDKEYLQPIEDALGSIVTPDQVTDYLDGLFAAFSGGGE